MFPDPVDRAVGVGVGRVEVLIFDGANRFRLALVDEIPGFFIAAGHEGDGISLATVTGKLIDELIRGVSETIIPTTPLRFDRFAKEPVLQ